MCGSSTIGSVVREIHVSLPNQFLYFGQLGLSGGGSILRYCVAIVPTNMETLKNVNERGFLEVALRSMKV